MGVGRLFDIDGISDWDWAMEAAAQAASVWLQEHPELADMFAMAMRAQMGDEFRDVIIATFKAEGAAPVYDRDYLVNRLGGLTRSQFDPIQRDRDMWRKSSTTAMSMLIDAVRASGGVLRIKPSDVLARRPTDRLRQELHPATNCMILTIDSVEVD